MQAHEKLKAWRAAKKLSQLAAAKLIGVSQPTWWDWEQARKTPIVEHRGAIARVTRGAVSVAAWGGK